MESFDLMMNTRLPPRKRLLAGFLRESSYCEFLPPIPSISGELGMRIREVINLPNSTSDEIIEVAESVALAAADIAVAARKKAMEKADAAAKARAAAKTALQFLESISSTRGLDEDGVVQTKFRKKQVPIKLFYKTSLRAGSQETDEELARRLHHAMNSSPRISSNKRKTLEKSLDEVISNCNALCNVNSAGFLSESTQVTPENVVDKLDEKIAVFSKVDVFMEDEEESTYSSRRKNDISKDRVTVISRKSKNRRKKLLLNRLNVIDQQEATSPAGCGDNINDKESKVEESEKPVPVADVLSLKDCETTKITSKWKCKKLSMPQCSSDSKFLHALC